jgi:hypothetical protein
MEPTVHGCTETEQRLFFGLLLVLSPQPASNPNQLLTQKSNLLPKV